MTHGLHARALGFVIAVQLVAPRLAAAQLPGTPEACDSAVTALQEGRRSGWAWSAVTLCDAPGAAAVAGAITAALTETDSVVLGWMMGASSQMRDAGIFNAAVGVASDQAASQPARVASLLAVLGQHNNDLGFQMNISWAALVSAPRDPSCGGLTAYIHPGYDYEGSLPVDYVSQAVQLFEALWDDPSESLVIRRLAECFRVIGINDAAPLVVDPDQLTLTYACGNKFAVENSGRYSALVTYRVVGAQDEGHLSVRPGIKRFFTTEEVGVVELLYEGEVVETHSNGGVPCP